MRVRVVCEDKEGVDFILRVRVEDKSCGRRCFLAAILT